jgi:hypothetical protein
MIILSAYLLIYGCKNNRRWYIELAQQNLLLVNASRR